MSPFIQVKNTFITVSEGNESTVSLTRSKSDSDLRPNSQKVPIILSLLPGTSEWSSNESTTHKVGCQLSDASTSSPQPCPDTLSGGTEELSTPRLEEDEVFDFCDGLGQRDPSQAGAEANESDWGSRFKSGHDTGNCTPCIWMYSKSGCSSEDICVMCHLPHARRGRIGRPSKARRLRCRKRTEMVDATVKDDPNVLLNVVGTLASESHYMRACLRGMMRQMDKKGTSHNDHHDVVKQFEVNGGSQ
eukprot:gnl/TRDRNA2_/TRDRNA2_89100_c0_seq1.p1 gnl/TRDRNA2_/TRDRNA2_89100_c0~~gnl/TRDRNA2_/TRDRNA2_89100_c0_seq1.p1  ORF type:complete len:264 (-),score=13.94 gnl/TRDRNA2_/TRDRNA2_89100_c0_seq1:20-757(-)